MSTPLSPKVTAAAAAGAAVVILVWLLDRFAGVDVPTTVQGALIVILMAAAGWVRRDPLRDAGQEAVQVKATAPATPVGELTLTKS